MTAANPQGTVAVTDTSPPMNDEGLADVASANLSFIQT